MDPKLIELAETMGVTAEYLWAALLRQAPIEATMQLMFWLLAIALAAWGWSRRLEEHWAVGDSVSADTVAILFARVVGSLVAVMALLWRVPMILAGFFNPEYWALTQVLEAL